MPVTLRRRLVNYVVIALSVAATGFGLLWLVLVLSTLVVNGIGANLTNDEKRAHLTDLRREHLIDQVCVQEILPPEK